MTDQPIHYTKEDPKAIERMAAAGEVVLLDVREQDEWDAGHLKHAQLLSLSAIQGMATASETGLPPEKPIYSYCKAGVRSVYATSFLRQMGFDSHAIQQGFHDLADAGLETE